MKTKTRKNELLRFRATEQQRKLIEKAAEDRGMTVSQWLRWLAIRATSRKPLDFVA